MSFPLSAYLEAAMAMATYHKLADWTFGGEVPKLAGLIAFGKSLKAREVELRSTLDDWLLVGLRLGHKFPKLPRI